MLVELESYCRRKNVSRIEELIGKAADVAKTYGELPVIEREKYPWEE
jgi:hypothetical protein